MRAALLFLSVLPCLLSAQTLTVATDVWPPFRMLQGDQIVGYDIDVLNEVAARTELTFSVEQMPWARALRSIEFGQSDIMVGLARTPERARYIDYLPLVYKSCRPAFYGLEQYSKTINTYDDLAPFRVGYVIDSAYFERFDEDNQLLKTAIPREIQLLKMANRGNIELLIGTDCQVDYELTQRKTLALTKAPWQPAERIDLYFGFSQLNELDAAKSSISKALQSMQNDGYFDALNARYFGPPTGD